MHPQVLAAQQCQRSHPHDTGFRQLPWALIQYVENGPYNVDCDQQLSLNAGEAWIIPPKMPNRVYAPKKNTSINTTWIHFRCQLKDSSDIFDHYTFPRMLNKNDATELRKSMNKLLHSHTHTGDSISMQIQFEKRKLLFLERLLSFGTQRTLQLHPRTQEIKSLLMHVGQNLSRKWDRDLMAQEVALSPSRFHDVFKAVTNESPAQWLRQQRVDHAKDLLAHSNLSIQDIAVECGFDDPYHFSRVFKQCEGDSPRTWRKNNTLT